MKRIILFAIMILLLAGGALAQDDQGLPNDPETNPRANACFAGGTLEGQCDETDADRDGDVDREDINFMWWCGWYIIRAQQGILQPGQYPAECYTPFVQPVCPGPFVVVVNGEGDFEALMALEAYLASLVGDDVSEAALVRIFSQIMVEEGDDFVRATGDVNGDDCIDYDLTFQLIDFDFDPDEGELR